ncbi:putative Ig domain-containing protein [Microvirga arabica]|uniref:putative Ig domain-containing protein n=1 Tax=Microvirga arabica TaxID=1128671 RepID=UPI001FEC57EE|nr:putative Ig domain-containing protein [Microvirga arabica]
MTDSSNLLVNGSFEASPVSPGTYAGFQTVAGWTAIPGGTIEIWNAINRVQATDGVNFVELDYGKAYDGFYQDVQTQAGQAYTLSFDARSRPGYSSATTSIEVLWNGTLVATVPPGSSWATSSFTVTGTGGLDRLTFRELQAQSTDGHGAMLDNIKLVGATGGGTPNQPPVAGDDSATTAEDTVVNLAVRANDTDADPNTTLTITQIAGRAVAAGSSVDVGPALVTLNPDGTLKVAPDPNFNGVVSFVYRVSDGALTDEGAVAVNVTPVPDAPVLASALADQSATKDQPFNFTVPATAFTDPDGDALTYTAGLAGGAALPSWLSFSAATRTFTGTPSQADVGSLSVQVVASDGSTSASDTFTLTINPEAGSSNLLVNGSFEASPVSPGTYAGFQTVAGWTAIPGGTIEIWNAINRVQATDGVNFVELDYGKAYDGFYQDVQTQAGQAYTLSFDARSRPGYSSATTSIEVLWNGTLVATVPPGSSWATSSFTVTGTGGLDRLTFRELQAQSTDGHGAMLDNIKLVGGAPDPHTLLSFANQTDRAKVVDLGGGFWTDAARVLPLGASNTNGWDSSIPRDQWEGYRLDLWNLASDSRLWFDYVGSRVSGPNALPDRDHHGISGITATEVVGLATNIASTYRPNVVLLMLGTNDALRESNAADTVPGELLTIMQRIAAAQPNVEILLAPIPPIDPLRASTSLSNSDEIANLLNSRLPGIVQQAQANGINATFVPVPNLTTADLTDGVHLTHAGFAKYAAAWFNALQANISTENGTFGGQRTAISGIVDIQGSELGDSLRGNSHANVLDGRGGADRIEGAGGADRLTGGMGADTFVYGALAESSDTITDFVSSLVSTTSSDVLSFSASGFGGGLAQGSTVSLVQGANPVATNSHGQFLFDTDDHALLWDVDGTGGTAPTLISTLSSVVSLSANDFLIVA